MCSREDGWKDLTSEPHKYQFILALIYLLRSVADLRASGELGAHFCSLTTA